MDVEICKELLTPAFYIPWRKMGEADNLIFQNKF